ncbi:Panacea domain-containing protein [Paenisporosarcina sp.]|uniref:Panacea domain-containing protein n=1 Tax=Paenisporosarcina sp. TaxID=1932001 RepID=UPI003C73B3C9
MVKHFIAISSLYSQGIRIAWHYAAEKINQEVIREFLNSVKKKNGDVQLGIHQIATDSSSWDSVIKYDEYFKDIVVYNEKKRDDFIASITEDHSLKAMDVAKFILSLKPVSHLKLQKLTYFSYERFLKATGVKLFPDEIVAWKYGPVVPSIYEHFKKHGKEEIENEEPADIMVFSSELMVPASYTKILTSEHGSVAFEIITSVIQDHLDKDPWDLVTLSHAEGSPWDKVYKPDQSRTISDDIILSYA